MNLFGPCAQAVIVRQVRRLEVPPFTRAIAPDQGDAVLVSWRFVCAVAVAYAAGSLLAFEYFHARAFGAVLFVSAGVSFAALVHPHHQVRTNPTVEMGPTFVATRSARASRWSAVVYRWASVLGAIAFAELMIDLAHGQSLRAALGFVLANTAEPLVGAGLFLRYFRDAALTERRGLLGFLVCGVLAGPFVGGLIGATTISMVFHQRWVGAFLPFWFGDGLGVLTVGGAILAVSARRSAGVERQAGPIVVAVAITVVATIVGFWPSDVPLVYLPMPLLFWFAFRRDLATVAMAGVAMAITANVMSADGRGPWGKVGPTGRLGLATLQAFLAIALVSAWLLAVEIAETKRARTVADRFFDEAHALQRALLPVIGATVDGVEAWARYRPADSEHDVGGDWFDVFALPGGRIAFAVGDVVGHDLAAAVAMSRLQSAMRALAVRATGPADLLQQLDFASTQIPNASLATIAYGDFNPATGRLRYACAGHPPFFLATADGGDYLWDGRSTPLDAMSTGTKRAEAEVLIPSQSWLVGFTDGLIERRGEAIDAGMERLRALASSLPTTPDTADWCDGTMASLIGDHAQDDAVIMCVRLRWNTGV
jgi:integral membrane sensor domain MASE1